MARRINRTGRVIAICAAAVLAIGCAIGLSGCGGAANGEVYVYCYGDYFDTAMLDKFEDETGIKVILDTYDTAEEMYTVLENDATTYDVICTSDYMIEKLVDNGMCAELDYDNIPNIKNIDPIYLEKSEVFDPGNKYSVPYQVGTAGIAYNPDLVGDVTIDSWDDLWNRKFADQIVMPDSVRDAFMISLKRLGYSENTTNESEISEAAKALMDQKGLVYRYANDAARDLLIDESAAVGVVWNGEYIYITNLNDKIKFVVPKEGTEFFIDSWFIPKNAANKANAEAWINFMCDGEIAAQNFDYLGFTTPNKAAQKSIDAKYLNNEAVFPTEETIANCESLRTLPPAATDLYSKYWKKVKAE